MSLDNIIIKLNNLIKTIELKKKSSTQEKNRSSNDTKKLLDNTYKVINEIIDVLETRNKN